MSQYSQVDHTGAAPVRSNAARSACGQTIADLLGLASARSTRTVSLRSAQITATKIEVMRPRRELTARLPTEKALIMNVWLAPVLERELWKWGKPANDVPYPADSVSMLHLEEHPQSVIRTPLRCMQFHFPELAFRELSADQKLPSFDTFWSKHYEIDPTMAALSRILFQAMSQPDPYEGLFYEHILLAIHAHLIARYSTSLGRTAQIGGLSIGQVRRAKELLTADLTSDQSIGEIAAELHIPASHFGAAFKISTGLPPHKWLRQHRVDTAKSLLRASTLTLAEIAYTCGFCDQSHLTRVFHSATGVSPGVWRRNT